VALRAAMPPRDFPRIAYYAHRMRGACAFVAQDELAAACHALESAARAADAQRTDACCGMLIEALARFDAKGPRALP
jgi:HPt (histidine-containing phosphotransfer) domain-containing protein